MRQFTYLLLVIAVWLAGCSSGDNPLAPGSSAGTQDDASGLSPGIIGLSDTGDIISAIGMMGAWELAINPDELTANLVAKRSGAIGEAYIVSGMAFFTINPCTDCLKLESVSIDLDFNVIITFDIKHPFDPGDSLKPPTAVNRLDLDVFDLALLIQPINIEPDTYSLTGKSIYAGACAGADGYTSELSSLLDDTAAMPYFLVVNDSETGSSTWNKFIMGANQTFDAGFNLSDQILMFNMYLTMGYGFSAKKPNRLIPKYYNPEFNRKAAWKVDVSPPGPAEVGSTWVENDDTTPFDVEVRAYDWQQDATVYATPDDFENAPGDNIFASSDIASVSVEIPGMTNSLPSANTAVSGTGTPDDPLVFNVSVVNENLLEAGQYTGLVKVTDERIPSSDWQIEPRDFMIDSPDGVLLNNYIIPEYAVYQVFNATVVEEPFVPPGNIFWAKNAVGPDNDQSFAIAALSDSSTVVSGLFRSNLTFAMGESNETTVGSAGQNDIFIARYDPDGALLWVKRVGAAGWETTFGITALSDDSVVITGIFGWAVTFGQGEPNQITLQNYPNDGVFVARYNPDGTLEWAKAISGTGRAYGNGVTALSDDSTIATGWFAGTYTFGKGELYETSLTNGAGYNGFEYRDIFVAKYNPDGTLAWAKRAGGSAGRNDGIAVTALSDGTAVVTGYFYGTAFFGQGEPNQTSFVCDGVRDIFVARYDTDGTLMWAKKAGGPTADSAHGITTLSDDSVTVTGYFTDSAIFGEGDPNETTLVSAGAAEIFIARYDADGALIWAKCASGVNSDSAYAATTILGDISVVTGYFTDEIVFGQSEPNERTLTTGNVTDTFIAWYNPDGTVHWAEHAATGVEYNSSRDIAALPDNSIAITGLYRSPATFGPGDPNETNLSHVYGYEVFIARFGP